MTTPETLKVWDPWVRLTHWAIVLLLPFSYWTATTSRFDWHFISGYAILALVIFRIAWGLVGSDTARFARFVKSPLAALRHLRERHAAPEIGHNAAGGWMVVALLLLLLAQAASGLFADDLVFTRGPLARRVDAAWTGLSTSVHLRVFWVIVGCVVLHILAIIAYRVLRGQNLVRAMITGRMRLAAPQAGPAPRMGHPLLALGLFGAAGGFVWWISTLAPLSAF